MTDQELYDEWLDSKMLLARYKASELELRNKIIDSFINDEVVGTLKFNKGEYKITIGLSLNNKLDESELDTIYNELSDKEKSCIKYTPSLIAKEFKELSGMEKLFEVITIKPRQPTLKIDVLE